MQTFQHAINQLRHRQQLLAILVFSLVAIVVWIGFSLISSQKKTAISPELRILAEPLTPSLNQSTIQRIEDRTYFREEELGDFPIFALVDPKSKARPTASSSAEPAASPAPEQTESSGTPESAGSSATPDQTNPPDLDSP